MASGSVVLSLFMPDIGVWYLFSVFLRLAKSLSTFCYFQKHLFLYYVYGCVCDTRDLTQDFVFAKQVLHPWAVSPDVLIFILR